jgi:TetR/AcrR family transcriptional repressor of nem operon
MRYKEYNRNAVLEKAIRLFWQMGFNGCSINEIVEATGVNRFSLYHEFGSKEGILYASLELYGERYSKDKFDLLKNSDGELHKTLMQFYTAFLEDNQPMAGCYFIHVGTELADADEQIRESLNNYLNEIRLLIQGLLIRNGIDQNVDFYAKHLLALFCTVMSFCLIHSPAEYREYVANGINIILPNYAENVEQ